MGLGAAGISSLKGDGHLLYLLHQLHLLHLLHQPVLLQHCAVWAQGAGGSLDVVPITTRTKLQYAHAAA